MSRRRDKGRRQSGHPAKASTRSPSPPKKRTVVKGVGPTQAQRQRMSASRRAKAGRTKPRRDLRAKLQGALVAFLRTTPASLGRGRSATLAAAQRMTFLELTRTDWAWA